MKKTPQASGIRRERSARWHRLTLALVLIGALFTQVVLAQETKENRKAAALYLEIGGGAASSKSSFFHAELLYLRQDQWGLSFSGEQASHDSKNLPKGFQNSPSFYDDGEPNQALVSYNLRLVRHISTRSKFFVFGAEAGIGFIHYMDPIFTPYRDASGDTYYTYSGDDFSNSVGLSLRGKMDINLLPFLGIGAAVSTNVNPKFSYVAYDIYLKIGLVRRRVKKQ